MSDIENTLQREPSVDGSRTVSEASLVDPECNTARCSTIVPPEKLEEAGKLEEGSAYGVTVSEPITEFSLDPPDGGLRAWLVVLGASCGALATFGYVNSWGVFQAYYEETLLKDSSPSTIAWIGSLEYALVFIPGLVSGRLFDMGHMRLPVLLASIALVISTMVVAECSKYWHFLLVQGLISGVSCGILFTPALSVVSHWFRRRKGLAFGLVALGSSVGGTTFPIAARRLIAEVGFPWTMRIIAFIQIATLAITNICLAQRLPPRKIQGPFFTLRPFKSFTFSLYCISELVSFLGLYTVLTYIDISAESVGISPDFSFYLIAIANAGSSVGRLGGGILGDRFGPLNVMIPCTLVAGVLTYAWPFASTQGQFVAVAIIYGIASGVFICLLVGPLVEMGASHEIGLRVGLSNTVLAIGALTGPPISGAINTATGGFKFVGIYAGSVVVLSVVLMILLRHLLLGRFWGKI